ncbi:hypothetical protein ACVIHH_008309 [Bradyrhizobium sp. USDA 4518]
MTPSDLSLANDVETLKAMVLPKAEKAARADALASEVADLKARNADADARIERLTQILKAIDRARFGRRPEKLGSANGDDQQQAFVFEEIETDKAQVSKGRAQADGKRAPRPARILLASHIVLPIARRRPHQAHGGVGDLAGPSWRFCQACPCLRRNSVWGVRPILAAKSRPLEEVSAEGAKLRQGFHMVQ